MPDEATRKPFTAVVVDARGRGEADSLAAARSTLRRWRRTGLAVAIVCSRAGAHALPDHELFELVIDEEHTGHPDIDSTVRLLGEATLRVDAAPLDTLVVAHAVVSVAAAQALGFRRIVGVASEDGRPDLLEAGAKSVVDNLRDLRFPRLLPSALQCLDEISHWRAQRSLAVFLDFDGTLTPIVAQPEAAWLEDGMRGTVAALAQRYPVAVISGRDCADVARRVGVDDIYYAGGHGLEIAGPGTRYMPPGADGWARTLTAAADSLERTVRDLPGVAVERKRFSVAIHYRQADATTSNQAVDAVETVAADFGLRLRPGKQVRELVPDLAWHKGRALEWLRDALGIDPTHTCLIYIGDDETDEDAFRALGPDSIGLRPGARVAASLADYRLADVSAVGEFLQWLATEDTGAAPGTTSS